VGQQSVVNLQMAPSALQESVTVTGEAPLIDVTSSKLGGNINPRQMEQLPVNGRNWMDLAIAAPGPGRMRAQQRAHGRVGARFEDGRITRIAVYLHCPWILPAATSFSSPSIDSGSALPLPVRSSDT
jgi:hypothetical protein